MAELDLDTIRHALGVAQRNGCAEVQLESGSTGFSARLGARSAKNVPGAASTETASAPASPNDGLIAITAGCVGFFQPTDSMLSLGRAVEKGEIVATIAALGLANDVECPVTGEVVEVLVEAEQPVEFGQTLALVKASE